MSPSMRKGVKILCPGDLILETQKPNYNPSTHADGKCIEVTIPASHPIYNTIPTSISTTMSLPLLLLTRPLNPLWSSSPSSSLNPSATALALNADPASPDWGTASKEWREDVGSVLVVRQDGKDLSAFQVWALIGFCEDLKGEMERAGSGEERMEIVKGMSPSTFERYFEGFMKEVVEEEDWDKVISMYKV